MAQRPAKRDAYEIVDVIHFRCAVTIRKRDIGLDESYRTPREQKFVKYSRHSRHPLHIDGDGKSHLYFAH